VRGPVSLHGGTGPNFASRVRRKKRREMPAIEAMTVRARASQQNRAAGGQGVAMRNVEDVDPRTSCSATSSPSTVQIVEGDSRRRFAGCLGGIVALGIAARLVFIAIWTWERPFTAIPCRISKRPPALPMEMATSRSFSAVALRCTLPSIRRCFQWSWPLPT